MEREKAFSSPSKAVDNHQIYTAEKNRTARIELEVAVQNEDVVKFSNSRVGAHTHC